MAKYTQTVEAATSDGNIISGQSISRAVLSNRERAEIAIDVIEGRAQIVDLTDKQVARVCGVPAGYLRAFRNAPSRRPTRLVDALKQATLAERLEAARALGLQWMFENIVNPAGPPARNGGRLNNNDDLPF